MSFKPTFSLCSFTFIKRFFSSYSLSAVRVVSSAYLSLLIRLLVILIPICASSFTAALTPQNIKLCKSETRIDKTIDMFHSIDCWYSQEKWGLFIKWFEKSVYFPRWPQYFTHILVKTWHWLSFLKSVQACGLSITDAISELLGVGHKKPLSLCLVSWGHSCLNPAPCWEEPRPGGRPHAGILADSPSWAPRYAEVTRAPGLTPCPDIRKSLKPTQSPEPRDNNCFKWLKLWSHLFLNNR